MHSLADIIGFRLLAIAAGYEDANDADSLRRDPLFKMALERLPFERDLCSQATISRRENLPDTRALLRMGRAMIDLYCASFRQVPKRADGHYACPEVLDWCEGERIDYVLGLPTSRTLRRHVTTLEASTAARFQAVPGPGKVRRFKEFSPDAGCMPACIARGDRRKII